MVLVFHAAPAEPVPRQRQPPSPGSAARGTLLQQLGFRRRFCANLTVSVEALDQPQVPAVGLFRRLTDEESFSDHYTLLEEISAGGNSEVWLAKLLGEPEEVVVKMRRKVGPIPDQSWRMMMAQLRCLSAHAHVLDMLEIVEDASSFYVVMPKCSGGMLQTFLDTETEVPETECKRMIREIVTALGHLHDAGLVHRDVKPENIMFKLQGPQPNSPKSLVLIDMDTCTRYEVNSPRSRMFAGTPGYIAPEALLGEITPKSDLWSVGVILYLLMTGESPWSRLVTIPDGKVGSAAARRFYNAMRDEVIDWDAEHWASFPHARDLCRQLMAFSVQDRPSSVREVLAHPWLAEH